MHKFTSLIAIIALTSGCIEDPGALDTPTPASATAQTETAPAEPVSRSSESLQVTVDDSFAASGLQWDSNGSELFIRYRPVMEDGQMYICGAYTNRGASIITRLGRQAMGRSTIKMNGETVLRGLSFFNIVSSANRATGLVGTTAFCRNTGLSPSKEEFATVRIDIPTGRYRIQR